MPLMDSSVDWTWPMKESVILKICQQKVPKLKKAKRKNGIEYPTTMWQI